MKRFAALALLVPLSLAPVAAGRTPVKTVGVGETWLVASTTHLSRLTLAAGGAIVAPAGDVLTLTVDGVEQGSKLTATGATTTAIVPGTYRGDVVVSVTEANDVTFGGLTFPIRQALYVGASGVDDAKSVTAALRGGKIVSTGEAFNGVYVDGATYALRNPRITMTGNGRSDFVGYGAAIVGTDGANLTVDGAVIDNRGAVRTGVVADGGSTVIVKNSRIHTANGVLPSDYVSTVDTSLMEDVPWMLGLSGNARATNLLGNGTRAAYVSSDISSEGWGVLSTDSGQNTNLAAINSHVAITGKDGYGSYAIGNATEHFLGTTLDVATYAAINRGGALYYGDSTRSAVDALGYGLGALPVRPTTAAHPTDAVATFTDIALKGDFYNAIRGSAAGGRNMVVTLDGGGLTGVVTSSRSRHRVSTITSADYEQLGVVTNTAAPAINNGALVSLTGGADWTVTGTSYLTKLSIGAGSHVAAPRGRHLSMTVDGVPRAIAAGATYTGAIVLSVH